MRCDSSTTGAHEPSRRLTSSTTRLDSPSASISILTAARLRGDRARRQSSRARSAAGRRCRRWRRGWRSTIVTAIASVADREHRLSRDRDPAEVIAGQSALGHRVLDRFSLADEVEHHHRVGEQRDHRGEDAEGDVAREVGAEQSEDGGRLRGREYRGRPRSGAPEPSRSSRTPIGRSADRTARAAARRCPARPDRATRRRGSRSRRTPPDPRRSASSR